MRNIIKPLIALILTLTSSVSYSQICLGNDTTVCLNQPLTLNVCDALTNVNSQTVVLDNVTNVSLSDDVWSAAINIGFTFNFYGVNYTQCLIGSNGLLGFDISRARAYCEYSTANNLTFPNTGYAGTRNTAMIAFSDINPGAGGQVYYKSEGVAPNRRFFVVYDNVPSFSASDCNFLVIILFEGSNNIEYHISNKAVNVTWNGGRATQGVQNNAGSQGVIHPGRNNQQWTAVNDAKLYTPTAPNNTNNYTISNIPLKIIRRTGGNVNFQWRSTTGQTYAYNNGRMTVPTNQVGRIGYILTSTATGCSAVAAITNDTTWVTVGNLTLTTSNTTDICQSSQGTATVVPAGGSGNYTYNWPTLGQTTPTALNVPAGTHQVQVRDNNGCTGNANITVPNQNASYAATSTLISCVGGADGTATATMTPLIGTPNYLWSNGQTTQTATGLSAGTYTCTISTTSGCSGTVTVTVTEIPGLNAVIANFTDVTCNSGNDGSIEVTANGGTQPYNYLWSGSDSATSNNASRATDLFEGEHTIIVSDANGCSFNLTQQINQPSEITISYITPETQICPEHQIELSANANGGSSNYIYNWYLNGVQIGNTQNIIVDPSVTNTSYCVSISEECGSFSPAKDTCTTITFPTPIPPQLAANFYENCQPGILEFTNVSPNIEELASTYIEFGDNKNGLFLNGAGGTHDYPRIGSYTLRVTNTSIYGCEYATVLENFFTVLPPPTARFNFQNNPTSVFETVVPTYNKSTPDVVRWQWYAPGSTPSTSTLENPIFTYPEGDEGTYPVTLIVESYLGCMDTLTLDLIIEDQVLLFAPNAFTPNGDEFNNLWRIYVKGIDIYSFNMVIYNRWGEAIFESNNAEVGWDGTYNGNLVPTGQYSWKAEVRNKNNDGKHIFNGGINLLR